MKILHIDSSITGAASVSRQLTAQVLTCLLGLYPDAQVIARDLGEQPIAHLSGAHLAAFQGAGSADTALAADIAAGQEALAEFLAADVVVVGAPMYNFSIPSQLKAWVDRLAIAGQTFRYTENGPVGLAGGKKVIVVASRGGYYLQGTQNAAVEHQDSYLRAIFEFFGISDIEIIYVEGTMVSEQARHSGIAAALARIDDAVVVRTASDQAAIS